MNKSLEPVLPAAACGRPRTEGSRATRTVVAISLGNWLELYDFTVFSFFAVLIGKLYFPSDSAYGSLLSALATFGIGFLMRPLGSVVIGRMADRVGRKPALTLTIWLMAAGTAIIGLAPTHAQIGMAAPLLLVLGRLLQGFSAGGEIGTATSYLMESGPRNRRGFMVSWQMTSQGAAILAGALSGVTLSSLLSIEALESWGWRIPFLLGLLIGPVGLYIRRHLDETHHPAQAAPPLGRLFLAHRRKLLLGCMMIMSGTANTYVVAYFMPSYLIKVMGLPAATSLLSGCVAGIALMVASPPGGWLADRLGRRKPMLITASVLMLLAIPPCFWLIDQYPGLPAVLLLVSIVMALQAVISPAGYVLMLEALPPNTRATGLSVIYATGVTVFGGFAPYFVTKLISLTGNAMAPSWYLMFCGVASLLALLAFPEERLD